MGALQPGSFSFDAVQNIASYDEWGFLLNSADVTLSVFPGGSSAGCLEEGNYLDAGLWAVGDAALTLSVLGKVGQVGAKASYLKRSEGLFKLSKSLAKFGKINSARAAYGATVAYGILGVKSGVGAVGEFADGNVTSGSIKALDALLTVVGAKFSADDYIVASRKSFSAQQRLLNAPRGGHYTDFADEAAKIMENAASSRGLRPDQNILNMAIPRNQALARLENLGGGKASKWIDDHIEKLTRRGSGPHIRTELEARLSAMEKLLENPNLGPKTAQPWLERIAEWRKRISEIDNVDW